MSTRNTQKPYVVIPNSIVRNRGITNTGKMIYTILAMSRNLNQMRLFHPTSIDGIMNIAGFKRRTENQKTIKFGFIELVQMNIISIYSDFRLSQELTVKQIKGSTLFFVKFNTEYLSTDDFLNQFDADDIDIDLIRAGFSYTTVYTEDAEKLLAIETKHSRANLFSFYLMAVSRALIGDKGYKYSTESIDSIVKYANINEKTALLYITTLFNEEILFKVTMREVIKKTKKVKDHNVYTRWCDAESITWSLEADDWFLRMRLLKVGEKTLSDHEVKIIRNKSRELHGLILIG